MIHIAYTDNRADLKVAILIKQRNMLENELLRHYIEPLEKLGIPRKSIIIFSLKYNSSNKAPAKESKEHLQNVLKAISMCKNITTIFCADGPYFKYLTGAKKTATALGYVKDCSIKDYTHLKVILGINYAAFFYNDNLFEHLDIALDTLVQWTSKTHVDPGKDVIRTKLTPFTPEEIKAELYKLHAYKELTCDIETFSLRFNKANIATIAFCWNKHEGVVFDVAYTPEYENETKDILRSFFATYEGELTFHGALFDAKVLIYVLYMKDSLDFAGMREGLKIFQTAQDSMVLLYLALNSTADVPLDLKSNAHTFTGDYAQENITDVTLIPRNELLEYNLVDGLATWFIKDKFTPIVKKENQWDFYINHAQPTINVLLKMMLTGLPMHMDKVDAANIKLENIRKESIAAIIAHPLVRKAEYQLQLKARNVANAKLKKKIKPLSDFFHLKFNPNSNPQLQVLFHEVMGLPVIDLTKKKAPATGADTIAKLIHHTTETKLLEHLINLAQVSTILDNFIKNFKEMAFLRTGNHEWNNTYWLNGDLKLTGTQGGRLSSANPNMQNIPSTGTKYAKLVKSCFIAPKGWLMVGADFSSLEDRINAILTQDTNKIKVYTDGYDGHCLRAYAYFGSDMPDIIDTVESINSIANLYAQLRQDSKQPTFALTYLGTWHTLVKNLGLSPEEAMAIEKNYHDLYKESDAFSKAVTKFANEHGYVELAFGLKLRTPILAKTILNSTKTPYEAEKEGRSANNAVTQSWGQLTTRAAIEFEKYLAKSPYLDDIFIANTIHDAIYLIIRQDPIIVKWVNDHLILCMQWNDDDKIRSTDVPMEAELEIYYPSWAEPHSIKNKATVEEITKKLEEICPEN